MTLKTKLERLEKRVRAAIVEQVERRTRAARPVLSVDEAMAVLIARLRWHAAFPDVAFEQSLYERLGQEYEVENANRPHYAWPQWETFIEAVCWHDNAESAG